MHLYKGEYRSYSKLINLCYTNNDLLHNLKNGFSLSAVRLPAISRVNRHGQIFTRQVNEFIVNEMKCTVSHGTQTELHSEFQHCSSIALPQQDKGTQS